jgi:hypothetical protein
METFKNKYLGAVIDIAVLATAGAIMFGIITWDKAQNKKVLEEIAQLPVTNITAQADQKASDLYGKLVDTNQFSSYNLNSQFKRDNPKTTPENLSTNTLNKFRYDPKFLNRKQYSIFGF